MNFGEAEECSVDKGPGFLEPSFGAVFSFRCPPVCRSMHEMTVRQDIEAKYHWDTSGCCDAVPEPEADVLSHDFFFDVNERIHNRGSFCFDHRERIRRAEIEE